MLELELCERECKRTEPVCYVLRSDATNYKIKAKVC